MQANENLLQQINTARMIKEGNPQIIDNKVCRIFQWKIAKTSDSILKVPAKNRNHLILRILVPKIKKVLWKWNRLLTNSRHPVTIVVLEDYLIIRIAILLLRTLMMILTFPIIRKTGKTLERWQNRLIQASWRALKKFIFSESIKLTCPSPIHRSI